MLIEVNTLPLSQTANQVVLQVGQETKYIYTDDDDTADNRVTPSLTRPA